MSKEVEKYHCVVSVVGYVAHGKTYIDSTRGTGKSCLCCRFTHPAMDDYIDDHPSLLALHEFESKVVSTENFLYWGPKQLEYSSSKGKKGAKVTVQVVEHTLFYHDETSKVFPRFKNIQNVDYYAKQALVAPDSSRKISYYSRDSIGFPDRYKCLPYPSNVNRIPRGFVIATDVSVKMPQFEEHFTAAQQIAYRMFKDTKQPFIIAATKRDMADPVSLQRLHDWASKKKITVIETSAKENINVRLVFSHIAGKILKAAKLPDAIISYTDAVGISLSEATKKKTKFKQFLVKNVRSSSTMLSTIEERPEYHEAVEMFGKFGADEMYARYLLETKDREIRGYPGVLDNPDMRMEMLEQFIDEIMDELIAHKRMLRSMINVLVSPDDQFSAINPQPSLSPSSSTVYPSDDHYETVDDYLPKQNRASDKNMQIEEEYDAFCKPIPKPDTSKLLKRQLPASAPSSPAIEHHKPPVTTDDLQVHLKKQVVSRNQRSLDYNNGESLLTVKDKLSPSVQSLNETTKTSEMSFQDRTNLLKQQLPQSTLLMTTSQAKENADNADLSSDDNSESGDRYGFLQLSKTQKVDNTEVDTNQTMTKPSSTVTKQPKKSPPPPPPHKNKPGTRKILNSSNHVPSSASTTIPNPINNQPETDRIMQSVVHDLTIQVPPLPDKDTSKPSINTVSVPETRQQNPNLPKTKPKPKRVSNYPKVTIVEQTQESTISPIIPKKGFNYQTTVLKIENPTGNNNIPIKKNSITSSEGDNDEETYISSSLLPDENEVSPKQLATPLIPHTKSTSPPPIVPHKMSSFEEDRSQIDVKERSKTTIRPPQYDLIKPPKLFESRKTFSTEYIPRLDALRKKVQEDRNGNIAVPPPSYPAPPLPMKMSPLLLQKPLTISESPPHLQVNQKQPTIEMSHSKSMEIANSPFHHNEFNNHTLPHRQKNAIGIQLPLPLPLRTEDMIGRSVGGIQDDLQTEKNERRLRSKTTLVNPSDNRLTPSKSRKNYTDILKKAFTTRDKDKSEKPSQPEPTNVRVKKPEFVKMINRPLPAEPKLSFDDDDFGPDYEPVNQSLNRPPCPLPIATNPLSPEHTISSQLPVLDPSILQNPKEMESIFKQILMSQAQQQQGRQYPSPTRNPARMPRRTQSVNYPQNVYVGENDHEYEQTDDWLPTPTKNRMRFSPPQEEIDNEESLGYDYPNVRRFIGKNRINVKICLPPPRSASSSPRKAKPRAPTPPLDDDEYTHMQGAPLDDFDYENFEVIESIKTGRSFDEPHTYTSSVKKCLRNNSMDDIHVYYNTHQRELQEESFRAIIPPRKTSEQSLPAMVQSIGKDVDERTGQNQTIEQQSSIVRKPRPLPPRNRLRSERSPPIGED